MGRYRSISIQEKSVVVSDGISGRADRAPPACWAGASPVCAAVPHGQHLQLTGGAAGSAQAAHRPHHGADPG
jgi:hypothetical protein